MGITAASVLLGPGFDPEHSLRGFSEFCMFSLCLITQSLLCILHCYPVDGIYEAWQIGYAKLPQGVKGCMNVGVDVPLDERKNELLIINHDYSIIRSGFRMNGRLNLIILRLLYVYLKYTQCQVYTNSVTLDT